MIYWMTEKNLPKGWIRFVKLWDKKCKINFQALEKSTSKITGKAGTLCLKMEAIPIGLGIRFRMAKWLKGRPCQERFKVNISNSFLLGEKIFVLKSMGLDIMRRHGGARNPWQGQKKWGEKKCSVLNGWKCESQVTNQRGKRENKLLFIRHLASAGIQLTVGYTGISETKLYGILWLRV